MNSTSPRSFQAIIITLLVIGLLALALSGYLTPLTRFIFNPILTSQTWLSTRYQALQDLIISPSDMTRLRQQNAELEAENSRLRSQVIELQGQISEVKVLSALVDFRTAHPEYVSLAAQIIAYDTSPFMKYVVINRGSDDGLRRGMPVVTNQGLVGRIAAVTSQASRVQLITDPAAHINVHLQPSEASGVLVGSLTGEITLGNVAQDANMQPGDLVLTSGLGGNYPPNLLIGQVTGVKKREYDLFQSASVQPVVDFARLDIALVITNFNPVDITPLLPTPAP